MFGQNPKRPPASGDGAVLDVVKIFPTFQGEGPFAGWPAVFLRLGGCNLACDFCDTEFEDFTPQSVTKIIDQIASHTPKLVVITGGEPFRQNISPLCEQLLAQGFQIQIETNGTLYRPIDPRVDIVCSPKMQQGRYHPIRDDLLQRLSAVKFIVSASHPEYQDIAPIAGHVPVYIQPMDEYDTQKNAANRAHALALAQKHQARLSLQTHKILGIE